MGYTTEGQSNTLSAPVTYLLRDVHKRAQDGQSPHICVPSNPLPLPCLRGISADREAQGRKAAGRVLGMRGEQHIFLLGNWANVSTLVLGRRISLYYVQWSFLDH